MRILTLVPVYLPGFKSGGPLRTIASMVDQLGETFDFWILTGDRDENDPGPYENVPLRQWESVGKAKVYYINEKKVTFKVIRELIREVNPDIVYLNSIFSPSDIKYLFAQRLNMVPQISTIAAPRGVFSPGALQLKRTKKLVYLSLAQWIGLFKGIRWQASSKLEKRDILNTLPSVPASNIYIAPNLANNISNGSTSSDNSHILVKESGHARFIFLSRIAPKKNLDYAITLLKDLDGSIDFEIYGPIGNQSYWDACLENIVKLPDNISVHIHGPVPHSQVGSIFSKAHFFLFPTLGENFGHVILEAMQAGCPALISDQTPWNALSNSNAGWVIPLDNWSRWTKTLQHCVDMDQDTFATYSENARNHARKWFSFPNTLEANKNMFLNTITYSEC